MEEQSNPPDMSRAEAYDLADALRTWASSRGWNAMRVEVVEKLQPPPPEAVGETSDPQGAQQCHMRYAVWFWLPAVSLTTPDEWPKAMEWINDFGNWKAEGSE